MKAKRSSPPPPLPGTHTPTLLSEEGGVLAPAPPEDVLLVFDWDDTILPTSFLARSGLRLDGPPPSLELAAVLDEYACLVLETLEEARRLGSVVILTNAETGWVELTVRRFLPRCADLVLQLRSVSARSLFEPQGYANPLQWKEHAFHLVVHAFLDQAPGARQHVLSLGDSGHEREAVLRVCGPLDRVTCKSLKFMEKPDLDSLRREHQLIRDCLGQIVGHAQHLDLCIQASALEGKAGRV